MVRDLSKPKERTVKQPLTKQLVLNNIDHLSINVPLPSGRGGSMKKELWALNFPQSGRNI
jgi:hypothetical protein